MGEVKSLVTAVSTKLCLTKIGSQKCYEFWCARVSSNCNQLELEWLIPNLSGYFDSDKDLALDKMNVSHVRSESRNTT